MADIPNRLSRRTRVKKLLFGDASGGVFLGMATLALGNGLGRIIGIATIPILTRLYTPESFGVLAVFTALVAILAPLVTLRYVLAIPLPRHDGVAMNLLVVSFGLMLGLSALMAFVLWLFGDALLGSLLAPWWWLIAVGVLGTAAYELLTMWATRRRSYNLIAQTSVTQSAAGAVVQIAMGLGAVQPLGLLAGQVAAQAGGVGRLLSGFAKEYQANWRHVTASRMRKTAWRHRGFPIWRVPSQFLMAVSMQAPMLYMATIYGAQTAGQFGLAMMALSVPVGLLGRSAGKALYAEAAVIMKSDPQKVALMATQVQLRLFFIVLVPVVILFFFGREIFVAAFGEAWEDAGVFSSLLSIVIAFQFTSAPLVQLVNLFAKQVVFLVINIFRIIGLVMVFELAKSNSLEANSTVALYSGFTATFYVGVSFFILRILQKQKRPL